MRPLDRAVLAERTAAIERHLRRVADRLPEEPDELQPATDASDAVVLHLWQATQSVIDLALALCLEFDLGTPASYADAFRRLAAAGYVADDLAGRLSLAAGFRNVVAHMYDELDVRRVHEAATRGPGDLRAFLRVVRDLAEPS
jgi:uncharacterized protein YutE (UPF0331/DUF86 family)